MFDIIEFDCNKDINILNHFVQHQFHRYSLENCPINWWSRKDKRNEIRSFDTKTERIRWCFTRRCLGICFHWRFLSLKRLQDKWISFVEETIGFGWSSSKFWSIKRMDQSRWSSFDLLRRNSIEVVDRSTSISFNNFRSSST